MFIYIKDKRINCANALSHPYLEEGRLRYHSCMCRCCHNVGSSRRYVSDLEPMAPTSFDYSFERELSSVHLVKGLFPLFSLLVSFLFIFSLNRLTERLHKSILEKCSLSNRVPLCINPHSAAFKSFARFAPFPHQCLSMILIAKCIIS